MKDKTTIFEIIKKETEKGKSQKEIADHLNTLGYRRSNGSFWYQSAVSVLARTKGLKQRKTRRLRTPRTNIGSTVDYSNILKDVLSAGFEQKVERVLIGLVAKEMVI